MNNMTIIPPGQDEHAVSNSPLARYRQRKRLDQLTEVIGLMTRNASYADALWQALTKLRLTQAEYNLVMRLCTDPEVQEKIYQTKKYKYLTDHQIAETGYLNAVSNEVVEKWRRKKAELEAKSGFEDFHEKYNERRAPTPQFVPNNLPPPANQAAAEAGEDLDELMRKAKKMKEAADFRKQVIADWGGDESKLDDKQRAELAQLDSEMETDIRQMFG